MWCIHQYNRWDKIAIVRKNKGIKNEKKFVPNLKINKIMKWDKIANQLKFFSFNWWDDLEFKDRTSSGLNTFKQPLISSNIISVFTNEHFCNPRNMTKRNHLKWSGKDGPSNNNQRSGERTNKMCQNVHIIMQKIIQKIIHNLNLLGFLIP